MVRLLFTAALLGSGLCCSAPARAEEYWVVRDSESNACLVVYRLRAATTTVVVGGDGTVYRTREEADAAMRKVTLCEERK